MSSHHHKEQHKNENKQHHSMAPYKDQNTWSQFQHELSQFFDRFNRFGSVTEGQFYPKIEIQDNDQNLMICAEIPGMNEKDVQVYIKDNNLVLEGERRTERESEENGTYRSEFSYGSFYRTIPLRDEVVTDSVKATYKDGLLRVKMDKANTTDQKIKKIPVTRS